jgi:hypothetical protein
VYLRNLKLLKTATPDYEIQNFHRVQETFGQQEPVVELFDPIEFSNIYKTANQSVIVFEKSKIVEKTVI